MYVHTTVCSTGPNFETFMVHGIDSILRRRVWQRGGAELTCIKYVKTNCGARRKTTS
jgi:hypothetical protein